MSSVIEQQLPENARKQRNRQGGNGVPPKGGPNDRPQFVYENDEEIEKSFQWGQVRRLLGYMAPYKKSVQKTLAITLVATLVRLIAPYLIGLTIDKAIRPGHMNLLFVLAISLLVLYSVNWIANRSRIYLTTWLGQKVIYDLRHKLFEHIQSLSFRFFDKRPAGSILVRVTNDVNSLQDLFTNGVVNVVMNIFMLVGIITILLLMNWRLALITMVTVPIMVFLTTKLRTRIRRAWQDVRLVQSRLNAHLNESIQGIRVTQAYTREKENMEWFSHLNNTNRQIWAVATRRGAYFGPLVDLTGAFGNALLFWYGAYLLQQGQLTVGALVAFANYLGNFWDPISQLGQVYNQLLVSMASSERIFEFLDTEPTVPELVQAPVLSAIQGFVQFEGVEFAYEPDRPALRGIDLTVEAGQSVALVGHTGSGKSTIINLLCRFYDPTAGSIHVDGIDLRSVTLESLRSQVGIVLQDTFIFSGTIMDNIRYGRLDATDDEVIEAAKQVQAHEFISQMAKGYQTEVKERGSMLSMGQRQLLSFARALLADPRVLILDEATASIDTNTEVMIQEALRVLLEGRTSFLIAHRLSTIRGADKIVVLDHGNIVEMGNHQSLMTDKGTYYNLIQAQYRYL